MSCIRFSTEAQQQQLRAAASRNDATLRTPARAKALPPMTEGKLRRLRLLADDRSAKIRESVASSRFAPAELYARLAADDNDGVRGCVAKNPAVPSQVLCSLVADRTPSVRAWLASNPSLPTDELERLVRDASIQVRAVAEWAKDFSRS